MWALINQPKKAHQDDFTQIKNLSEWLYWLKIISKYLRKIQVIKYCTDSGEIHDMNMAK